MDEKVILWTRQVPEVWKELQTTGEYHVKEEYISQKNDTISEFYFKIYKWFTKAARKYINIREEFTYPIWLSVDESLMLQPTENTVILKLEVPKEDYIIVNNMAWGYRVNYWYVPLDKEDEKKHIEELKKQGISNESDLILTDKGNFYPILKKKILDSWDRVFTLPPKDPSDSVATIWHIKKEWVKEVREYGG